MALALLGPISEWKFQDNLVFVECLPIMAEFFPSIVDNLARNRVRFAKHEDRAGESGVCRRLQILTSASHSLQDLAFRVEAIPVFRRVLHLGNAFFLQNKNITNTAVS